MPGGARRVNQKLLISGDVGQLVGTGAGIGVGPMSVSASVGQRRGRFGADHLAAFGLSFGDR